MDEAPAESLPSVIDDLLKQPQRYAFSQAVRLLRLWAAPKSAEELNNLLHQRLRFRPELSLAFAVSDVTNLELRSDKKSWAEPPQHPVAFEQARITASFLGLYGSSSPLPKFYTERLLDEMTNDGTVTRDFLDIFNNQFFLLHALLSSFSHPLYRMASSFDPKAERMLSALSSYGNESLCERLPSTRFFLRYAAFFFQRVRTESGLRAILADASGCPATYIRCNELRMARIPDVQRLRLGLCATVLGEESTLGDAVPSNEGMIIVEFDQVREEKLRGFLPGTRLAQLLHSLIRNYCRQWLDYAVVARLLPGQARALCLGGDASGNFARLGLDAWLGFGGLGNAPLPSVTAFFPVGFEDQHQGRTQSNNVAIALTQHK